MSEQKRKQYLVGLFTILFCAASMAQIPATKNSPGPDEVAVFLDSVVSPTLSTGFSSPNLCWRGTWTAWSVSSTAQYKGITDELGPMPPVFVSDGTHSHVCKDAHPSIPAFLSRKWMFRRQQRDFHANEHKKYFSCLWHGCCVYSTRKSNWIDSHRSQSKSSWTEGRNARGCAHGATCVD